jgi:hypothetical protein
MQTHVKIAVGGYDLQKFFFRSFPMRHREASAANSTVRTAAPQKLPCMFAGTARGGNWDRHVRLSRFNPLSRFNAPHRSVHGLDAGRWCAHISPKRRPSFHEIPRPG